MKLLPFLSLLASSAVLSEAATPTNCNTDSKSIDAADQFVLAEQADNPNVATLGAAFGSAGRKVTVSQVFSDGNHKMTGSAAKKAWEALPDFNDETTTKWVPQGISSTADALDVGTYEGRDGWVVSWHREDDASARVTFVDRADYSYRHVLLVYPHAADDFREVALHAGGIMWYGNTLWVVDTWNGIRVFDLDNIWHVDDGDGVGKKSGGGYSAAGYKYVLPQIRWYKWTPSFPFRFSYISLDRTTTPDSLVVGEYQTSSTDTPIRFARWELDYTTRRLKSPSAVWAYCVNIERMQGAVSANGKFYISRSNGGSAGDAFGWVPGSSAKLNAGFYPPSPEDMSYDKRNGGRVYTLTEANGARYVITDEASSFKFS